MKKNMKNLIFILVLFFSSSLVAEIYYCSEKGAIGFKKKNNMVSQKFKLHKFTIDINLKENIIRTDEGDYPYLGFAEFIPSECIMFESTEIYCINNLGVAFTFNEKSKNFNVAHMIKDDANKDDEWITYGTCSKF